MTTFIAASDASSAGSDSTTARRKLHCRAVNELTWVTLQVPDVEQSRRFWRDIIGLSEKSATPTWVELELRSGVHLALHPVFHPPALERRGYDRGGPVLGIRVESLDDMGGLVERNGARALGAAQDIPGGRTRDFEDPDGYVFELVELRA
jgi:catechol 2,3-dioxygenase-like lactoylglutathione lyase family enzyme